MIFCAHSWSYIIQIYSTPHKNHQKRIALKKKSMVESWKPWFLRVFFQRSREVPGTSTGSPGGAPPTRNHHSTWGVEHRGVLSHGVQPELEAFGSVVLASWENSAGETTGKRWENHWKMEILMGKPWENPGKMVISHNFSKLFKYCWNTV